ncbi:S-DNA-T family DNA segregation ATPase FtsK/SpoIIIE, partial [Kitasatospora sp. SolWspMP-SS2h]|uniref:FtsK/SpoIIIE domain-containing protein n=1 Tax=Kitasatospora sp. SolWspMP-SS2h TaxID=1305729 RepID=UPI000DC00BA8
RSAADGDDLLWSLEKRNFGVDTVTGEQVEIPLGERMLIAGMSGAGKSVASRPMLFEASEGDTNALVIFDFKKVEGRLWDHRARVVTTAEDALALSEELVEEMTERLDLLPKGKDKLTPTRERPRITVVVDEGAEVISAAKDALVGLESVARMGRAASIDLWWMTQKPTIPDGIPKQIAPQLALKICLAVSTPTEARVVLGEDAQAKGWTAEDLDYPGYALVRAGKSRKPHPVKVRYMTAEQVIALPDRPIWSRYAEPAAPARPVFTLVKNGPVEWDEDASVYDTAAPAPVAVPPRPDYAPTAHQPAPAAQFVTGPVRPRPVAAVPAQVAPAEPVPAEPAPAVTNRDRVFAAIRSGARTAKAVTEATGLNKGTVSREVKALTEAGSIRKTDDGLVVAAAGEVSA